MERKRTGCPCTRQRSGLTPRRLHLIRCTESPQNLKQPPGKVPMQASPALISSRTRAKGSSPSPLRQRRCGKPANGSDMIKFQLAINHGCIIPFLLSRKCADEPSTPCLPARQAQLRQAGESGKGPKMFFRQLAINLHGVEMTNGDVLLDSTPMGTTAALACGQACCSTGGETNALPFTVETVAVENPRKIRWKRRSEPVSPDSDHTRIRHIHFNGADVPFHFREIGFFQFIGIAPIAF